jgi:hypothetical protein
MRASGDSSGTEKSGNRLFHDGSKRIMVWAHFSVIRNAVSAFASVSLRLLFGSMVDGFTACGFFSQ